MKRTCFCGQKAAYGVIDKLGIMEPGSLCPRHYGKWKRSAFRASFVYLLLPGGAAVIRQWSKDKLAMVKLDERMLDDDSLYLHEQGAKTMHQIKCAALWDAIEANNTNIARAGRELQISKATIYRLIVKCGIKLNRTAKLTRDEEDHD